MKRNKKKLTSGIAIVIAMALLLGGTFAWQSISQTVLNEKEDTVNPGGRLHDDFDGSNKDVYVENFADDDIYARVRLDEYFEITMNQGTQWAKTDQITTGATRDEVSTYVTHKFGNDAENATDAYWDWTTGGSTTYMPTFNKNKDSLAADINGTMGYIDAEGNAKPYGDYVDYSQEEHASKTATEIYDGDSNSIDEVGTDFDNLETYKNAGNIQTVEDTHTAKGTETCNGLISMEEWIGKFAAGEATANYWVYDTDGWCYWSSPIKKDTATGLLLDGIALKQVMDDSYYYAINVVGQFITADDLGKEDNTGFYQEADRQPSANALTLLNAIGVEVYEEADEYATFTTRADGDYDLVIFESAAEDSGVQTLAEGVVDCNPVGSEEYKEKLKKTVSVSFKGNVQPTDMSYWFASIGADAQTAPTFNWTGLDTSKVTDMSYLFSEAQEIETLDVTSFDTSNVTTMGSMFYKCIGLSTLDVSHFDTSKVTDMHFMFAGYGSDGVMKLTELDLSNFDTSKVTSMRGMFERCGNLTTIRFGETFDTSKVTDMAYMFNRCEALTGLELSGFDTSNVTDMNSMFGYCEALAALDVSDFDTSKVTNMRYMFNRCEALTGLELSGFDTSNVTNMEGMFYMCTGLSALDVSNFDTSKVTNMKYMFASSGADAIMKLTELDLSNFNTSNVTNMSAMFQRCGNLTTIQLSGSFDTSGVTDMSYMFNYCTKLQTLDASKFNTSNVTTMKQQFYNCGSLTLDCSSWDVAKVTNHTNFNEKASGVTEPNWVN